MTTPPRTTTDAGLMLVECDWLTSCHKVCAFYTRRAGGVSTGAYASMNCTDYCGDDISCVEENRRRLVSALPYRIDAFVMPRQVHGSVVYDLRAGDCTCPGSAKVISPYGVDGIVTRLRNVCLGISTADCVPLLLSSDAGVVAAVHAGWRGTVAKIAACAVRLMTDGYRCEPAGIRAFIGPSISAEAFEVGDEVFQAFDRAGFDMGEIASRDENRGKWHIDLWQANMQLLESCGIPHDNIGLAGICSRSHSDEYFSARALGTESGRMLTGIMLI